MSIFNAYEIIGGTDDYQGSEFDDLDTLFNSYLKLLLDTLLSDGIVYSTGRNGLLAKVELDYKKGGLINYVQSGLGQWNYVDPKYQRIVSPEFVLYLFNNQNLVDAFNMANLRSDKLNEKFNSKNQVIDGVFFKNLNMNEIIELHEYYLSEKNKLENGLPNSYNQINQEQVQLVNILFDFINSVVKCSKDYFYYYQTLEASKKIKDAVQSKIIDEDDLNAQQEELYYFDENPDYFMSLGCFNNIIRKKAISKLVKTQRKKNSAIDQNLSANSITKYDDPIALTDEYLVYEDDGYDDEDSFIAISYDNGKEFLSAKVLDFESSFGKTK